MKTAEIVMLIVWGIGSIIITAHYFQAIWMSRKANKFLAEAKRFHANAMRFLDDAVEARNKYQKLLKDLEEKSK